MQNDGLLGDGLRGIVEVKLAIGKGRIEILISYDQVCTSAEVAIRNAGARVQDRVFGGAVPSQAFDRGDVGIVEADMGAVVGYLVEEDSI